MKIKDAYKIINSEGKYFKGFGTYYNKDGIYDTRKPIWVDYNEMPMTLFEAIYIANIIRKDFHTQVTLKKEGEFT